MPGNQKRKPPGRHKRQAWRRLIEALRRGADGRQADVPPDPPPGAAILARRLADDARILTIAWLPPVVNGELPTLWVELDTWAVVRWAGEPFWLSELVNRHSEGLDLKFSLRPVPRGVSLGPGQRAVATVLYQADQARAAGGPPAAGPASGGAADTAPAAGGDHDAGRPGPGPEATAAGSEDVAPRGTGGRRRRRRRRRRRKKREPGTQP